MQNSTFCTVGYSTSHPDFSETIPEQNASNITFEGEHFRAVLNFECDALSRLAKGYQVPKSLLEVPRASPPERAKAFFLAWPADLATGPAPTACPR